MDNRLTFYQTTCTYCMHMYTSRPHVATTVKWCTQHEQTLPQRLAEETTHCKSGSLNCFHHEICEVVIVAVGKDALLMHLDLQPQRS